MQIPPILSGRVAGRAPAHSSLVLFHQSVAYNLFIRIEIVAPGRLSPAGDYNNGSNGLSICSQLRLKFFHHTPAESAIFKGQFYA